MNIYEISAELRNLYEEIIASDGEITEELNQRMQLTKDQLEAKAESYCGLIRNVSADIEGYKTEIERLTARKRTAENLVQRLKDALRDSMILADQQKMKVGLFAMSLRSSESVEVTDAEALDDKYVQIERKPMKSVIKDAIKGGEQVAGAEIVTKTSVTIR